MTNPRIDEAFDRMDDRHITYILDGASSSSDSGHGGRQSEAQGAAPLSIEQAVQKRLDEIDERNLVDSQKRVLERVQCSLRCLEVAKALCLRIIGQENIDTPVESWFVTEVEQGRERHYGAVYNLEKPGDPFEMDDAAISGVMIKSLGEDAEANVRTAGDADGVWYAWHKCVSSRRFKTFTDAITFAMTGKN